MRNLTMSQSPPPSGFVKLIDAVQACSIRWECNREAAWPKLRGAFVREEIATARRGANGEAVEISSDSWGAVENDDAYISGLHSHPGPLRHNFATLGRAYVDQTDLFCFLDGKPLRRAPNIEKAAQHSSSTRGAKKNVDSEAFWREVERLVDEGLQADPRTAGHTVDCFADCIFKWAERNMQKGYAHSTIKRYLEKDWARLQERSRNRIK